MRLGVLDVGSNTVHLLVVDAHRGAHPTPMTSEKTVPRLAELGYRVVISPATALLAATPAVRDVLETFRAEAGTAPRADSMETFDGFLETIGLPEIREQEQRFSS